MKSNPIQDLRKELAIKEHRLYANHEKKVDEINNFYKGKINATREHGRKQLEQEQVDINARIIDKNYEYERKLKDLQANFDNLDRQIKQEKDNIQRQHEEGLEIDEKRFRHEATERHRQRSGYNDEMNKNFLKTQDRIQDNFKKELSKNNLRNQLTLRSQENESQRKLDNEKKNFENLHLFNEIKFEQQINQQRIQQENDLNYNKKLYHQDMKALEEDHKFKFQNQVKTFQQKMQQAAEDFAKKYQQVLEKYNTDLEALKNMSQKRLIELKESLIKQENLTTDQLQDSFYHPAIIEPIIEQFPKHYLISVKVPPHEHDKVLLSAKGREIRMTQSRDFHDTIERADGSMNRYNKSESYVKVFHVADIVDPKKVTREYKDGHIVFTLPKA